MSRPVGLSYLFHQIKRDDFERELDSWNFLGEVTDTGAIELRCGNKKVLESDIRELYRYWNREWT